MNARVLAAGVRARRKPLLLFRFAVLFLLRLAARVFCGLLFQEPPRSTRLTGGQSGFIGRGRERIEPSAFEEGMAQACRVGVPGMGDPGIYVPLDRGAVNAAHAPAIAQPAQTITEAAHIFLGKAANTVAVQHIAKKGAGARGLVHKGLGGVQ